MTGKADESVGLRARKKEATRRALQQEALRLAVEHGVDELTVEAISAAVGVSARTFFNYFGSKEEALLGDGPSVESRVREKLGEVAPGQPALPALRRAVRAAALDAFPHHDEVLLRKRLLAEHPVLLARQMANFAAKERAVAEAVAEHAGQDPDRELGPNLIAAMVTSVLRVVYRHWDGESEQALAELVDEAFDHLQAML